MFFKTCCLVTLLSLHLAAPVVEVAELLRSNSLTVCSILARVICETSKVLLAGGQVVFLGDLQF